MIAHAAQAVADGLATAARLLSDLDLSDTYRDAARNKADPLIVNALMAEMLRRAGRDSVENSPEGS